MMLEITTSRSPADVLAAAKRFFPRQNGIYAAFLERDEETFLSFRGQGGEELVIAVHPVPGGTSVRGSTYLFDQQVQRFFATLEPLPPERIVASPGSPREVSA